MVFRSKVDPFFLTCLIFTIGIMAAVSLLPLLLDKEASLFTGIVMCAIFIASTGFILWCTFSIQYVFYNDYLLVKGGPFRSKIPYAHITKVAPTNDIFTGYRILSSKQGIEIFYKSSLLGSVKISPDPKTAFIRELKKRCPHVPIHV